MIADIFDGFWNVLGPWGGFIIGATLVLVLLWLSKKI